MSTQERELFREAVRAFVEREVLPRAEELDEHGRFPHELFARLAELGYLGIRYPEEVGGQGADFTVACVLYEELAAGSLALAAICAMQSLMGTHFVYEFGGPERHERLLAPALRGEKVAAFALTEPGAGSDLGAMRTRARRDGDDWVIDGTKTWITNAPVADFITVAAKTSDEPGIGNVALFLVEAENPGFSVGRPIEKLGTRSTLTSEVAFEDCRVPADALLGEENQGVRQIGGILSEIRVMTAALSVGLGRRALIEACRYASEREAFGKPIGKHQGIAFKLAEMATDLHAARLMTDDAAEQVAAGQPALREAAMAKLFASEACIRICDETSRIFGGYGFAMEYPAQRYLRDSRFLLYGAGTSELLRHLIGNDVLKDPPR